MNLHKPTDNVDIGMAAKQKKNYKLMYVQKFQKEFCQFLSGLTKHMSLKCPLKHLIVRCTSAVNPNNLAVVNQNDFVNTKFTRLLEKLVSMKRSTTKVGDEAKEQYRKLLGDIVPDNREKFRLFDKFDQRVDVFYADYISGKDFNSLWNVFILIFCLSHGEAHIERGFKENEEFEVENLSESSLSLRGIHDHMQSKCITAANIPIIQELMKSVRLAKSRYSQAFEEQKTVKKATTNVFKRKIIAEEIVEIAKKNRYLHLSIDELVKDADALADKAEVEGDMTVLGRSNDLRKLSKTKKSELSELDDMIASLESRRNSLK